jgi:hypothetical protein
MEELNSSGLLNAEHSEPFNLDQPGHFELIGCAELNKQLIAKVLYNP